MGKIVVDKFPFGEYIYVDYAGFVRYQKYVENKTLIYEQYEKSNIISHGLREVAENISSPITHSDLDMPF